MSASLTRSPPATSESLLTGLSYTVSGQGDDANSMCQEAAGTSRAGGENTAGIRLTAETSRRGQPSTNMTIKSLVRVAAVVLMSASAHATFIPLSGVASVAASGFAGSGSINGSAGDTYSLSDSATAPFAAFNGSVFGIANWTIPPPGPGEEFFLPESFSASSHAAQNAVVNGSGISISGEVRAEHTANVGSPYASAFASATSMLDFVFRIDAPMAFTLMLDVSAFHGQGDRTLLSPPVFSLVALGGGLSLGMSDLIAEEWGWTYSGAGVLGTGDYRLNYVLDTFTAPDPSGSLDTKHFSLDLQMASVPEAGSTLVLLVLSLTLLAAFRKLGSIACWRSCKVTAPRDMF
jgi:hypothetical protein